MLYFDLRNFACKPVKGITMKKIIFFVAALFIFTVQGRSSAETSPGHVSKYKGQETRQIKTLSETDIAALENGRGWGLAKAAELNGVPGPKHLLEMAGELQLSAGQITKLEAIFEEMAAAAKMQGRKLIEAEMLLNRGFRERTIDEKSLSKLLENISTIHRQLRFIHLAAHLKTLEVVTEDQAALYNTLRGYSDSDPCELIPAGHDPKIWRLHNNCP